MNPSVSHCAKSGENFFAARFSLEAVGAKWGRQQRERPLESNVKRLAGKNKLVKENAAASNEPMNFRERMIMLDYGDFRNRAYFTFSLDNNSDILMLIEIILINKKACQIQYHCRMNKHPCSNRTIPSCEGMARTLSFIYYDRFDGNSLADMLEKSTSDWIRRRKPARKKSTIITAPFSTLDSIFCRLDPMAVISTLHQLSLAHSLLYFRFWFASSYWSTDISMV